MKKDLWDLLRFLEDRNQRISAVFGDSDFLDGGIDILWNLLLTSLGVPEETSEFNQDQYVDVLFEFSIGDISKKQAVDKINKLNKEFAKGNG